jgi:hypothetical protein
MKTFRVLPFHQIPNHKKTGLLDSYDTPVSLPCIAPRPLLIQNGALDPRCPAAGTAVAAAAAAEAYRAAGSEAGALQLRVHEGVGHKYTPEMSAGALAFFEEWL